MVEKTDKDGGEVRQRGKGSKQPGSGGTDRGWRRAQGEERIMGRAEKEGEGDVRGSNER